MKRIVSIIGVACMILCIGAPLLALAVENPSGDTPSASATSGGENVNITVMIPSPEPATVEPPSEPLPPPTPKPNPNYPELYPSDVFEFYDETSRQIIKTYELTTGENPAGISRDSFERDGWLYELTDITKKENAHASTQEHTESVTIETSSRDMEDILAKLAPTMEYQSDDGYIGILTLDVASIGVETAGTKKSSYTMTATREYPHLSSNDTSLVPKSITQNGVTYTLDNISWQTQGGEAIDYDYIPTSYTASAKYTASGTKTTVTGYTTTASYVGTISKILTGRTVYTAYFIGYPIAPPVPELEPIPTPDATLDVAAPEVTQSEVVDDTSPRPASADALDSGGTPPTEPSAEPSPEPAPEEKQSASPLLIALIVLIFAVLCGGGYYNLKKKEKRKKETANEEETV